MSDELVIPERWKAIWEDWADSLSGYAWKDTAQRAVRELGAAEQRIAHLEQQLKTVLDRESASQKRHDAKLDELQQQLANARKEALTTGADKIASLIRRSSFPGTVEFNDGIAEAHCAILALIAKEPQS